MQHMDDINRKYIALCAKYGLCVQILPAQAGKCTITEEDGTFILRVTPDIPAHLSYEKILVWKIREILLPRLVLETDRLILRRFLPADRDHCLSFLENQEDAYMDCCRAFSVRDADYYERVDLFLARETQYAVVHKDTGELIGTIHLFPDDTRAVDAMEIGYSIAHAHQRNGYATETLTALLALLTQELFVDLISAGTLPENTPSIALLQKLGFQSEGLRHHAAWHEVTDRPVDLQYFYLDRTITTYDPSGGTHGKLTDRIG